MWIKRSFRDWFLFGFMVIAVGSSFVLLKVSLATIPPITTAAARMALALMLLFPIMVMSGVSMPAFFTRSETSGKREINRVWRYLMFLATVGVAIPFSILSWAQQFMDASLTGILVAVMPLTTIVLAPILIKSESLTFSGMMGFILGFLGICLLMGPDALLQLGGTATNVVAQLAVLGCAICFGLGAVVTQRLPPVESLAAATGQNLFAMLLLLPIALMVDKPWTITPSTVSLMALVLSGVVSTGLGIWFFFVLVRSAGATFMALSNYLAPVWAVGMGMIFLGERPGLNAFIALLFIFVGLAISQLQPRALATLLRRQSSSSSN